jgi:hypothetical protein
MTINTPSDSFHLMTVDSVTLFHADKMWQATSSHHNWGEIREAIMAGDYDRAVDMIDEKSQVQQVLNGLDGLVFKDGQVLFDGVPQGDQASEMILNIAEEKGDLTNILRFFERLRDNPSRRAREQALEFVVRNRMPIAKDGRFLAYKRISGEWKDMHSRSIDNHVGAVVKMPRSDVDDDPTRTCAAGLHVCSQEYLKSFAGERLVACAVDPGNVVSVPIDYNNSKMRVCEYEVIQELPISLVASEEPGWRRGTLDEDYNEVGEEPEKSAFFYLLGTEDNIEYGDRYDLDAYEAALSDADDDDQIWMARDDGDGRVELVGRVE